MAQHVAPPVAQHVAEQVAELVAEHVTGPRDSAIAPVMPLGWPSTPLSWVAGSS